MGELTQQIASAENELSWAKLSLLSKTHYQVERQRSVSHLIASYSDCRRAKTINNQREHYVMHVCSQIQHNTTQTQHNTQCNNDNGTPQTTATINNSQSHHLQWVQRKCVTPITRPNLKYKCTITIMFSTTPSNYKLTITIITHTTNTHDIHSCIDISILVRSSHIRKRHARGAGVNNNITTLMIECNNAQITTQRRVTTHTNQHATTHKSTHW